MTIVVGYLAGKVGPSALHLAVRVARMHKTSLTVATIVRRHWPTPSLARVDAEYELWSEQLAAASAREAQRYLRRLADGIEVSYHHRAHRSVSAGLLDVVEELEAEVLVLGSFPSGRRARVLIGSTADRLLHSSPVPVAITPRRYRCYTDRLTRLSCGYSATSGSVDVVRRCGHLASRYGVPMRVITFAVRGRTMYPPEVGLHAEASVLEAWAAQARELLEKLNPPPLPLLHRPVDTAQLRLLRDVGFGRRGEAMRPPGQPVWRADAGDHIRGPRPDHVSARSGAACRGFGSGGMGGASARTVGKTKN